LNILDAHLDINSYIDALAWLRAIQVLYKSDAW